MGNARSVMPSALGLRHAIAIKLDEPYARANANLHLFIVSAGRCSYGMGNSRRERSQQDRKERDVCATHSNDDLLP